MMDARVLTVEMAAVPEEQVAKLLDAEQIKQTQQNLNKESTIQVVPREKDEAAAASAGPPGDAADKKEKAAGATD